uniref:DNA polymerase n=1 Tax=Gorilla gorilla herpesvirus 7 TaxID=1543219 RepID=A0A088QCZ0_9BETA|nr:DNA polymerase [Gorilla gorilla herpesvirus 7]AIN81097.1 DNA polymerase [Gorilla gorilla herpesvirus 7]AIN81108.1 DNA polymerase [Gorilla gorilla herpesvirus 7]AIN81109.1 DNA polymerase [Gorilla gorilla herpesvirus 7]
MDLVSFFNPYLENVRVKKKPKSTFLRIFPRGIMHDGAPGLMKTLCDSEPRMFYRNEQYILKNDMAWPSLSQPPEKELHTPLKFHIYDACESLLFTDSIENIPFQFRHFVIPSGNVIKLFGKTECDKKVCINVFGQNSYFYCEYECKKELNSKVYALLNSSEIKMSCSFSIESVTKYNLYGYSTEPIKNLFKLSFSNFYICNRIGKILLNEGVSVYEIEVEILNRFFIDNNFKSFGWYRINHFSIQEFAKSSNVEIELNCHVSDLCLLEQDSWPLYDCCSFDIECLSQNGNFPDAEQMGDIVIQISVIDFDSEGNYQNKHLFTLGTCEQIEGICIYEFASEFELLYAFFVFLKCKSPEIITGYNIINFDIKYLCTRMEKIYHFEIGSFSKLKRGKFSVNIPYEQHKKFLSNFTKVNMSGILCFDMYNVYSSKISAQNYKLDTIAKLCLNQEKENLSYKEIPKKFIDGAKGRAVVGKYCIQDSLLVVQLFVKINYHYEMAEVASLAYITIRCALFEGQQKKIFSCILYEAKNQNMILPSFISNKNKENVGYKGATVLEPKIGYYATPTVVFDFQSLYPSIMMAHNLCYSTLIVDETAITDLHTDDILTVQVGLVTHRFVKRTVRESILANLLQKWLSKRKEVKMQMKMCKDPAMEMLLDKKQLALKTTCNSVYGVTGATHSMLPCVAIAASVTCLGREMLCKTVDYVDKIMYTETFFIERFGLTRRDFLGSFGVEVIYGDTDSIFVTFKNLCPVALKRIAPSIASHITNTLFTHPIKLEFEKILFPLILICKKRYIGKLDDSTLIFKGVELVRKTSCDFVKLVVKDIIDLLFWDVDVQKAAEKLSNMTMQEVYENGVPTGIHKIIKKVCDARDALFFNRVDIKSLVLSSVLSKEISAYKQANLPHLTVVKRLAQRKEELPNIGDRIMYILIAPTETEKKIFHNYELAEDPAYAIEKNLKINADKYFEQTIKAVTNAISPIFPKTGVKKEKFLLSILPLKVYIDQSFSDLTYVL